MIYSEVRFIVVYIFSILLLLGLYLFACFSFRHMHRSSKMSTKKKWEKHKSQETVVFVTLEKIASCTLLCSVWIV